MKTHTVKWCGDKTHRIITFTPSFMELLLTAKHDMVVRVVLEYLTIKCKELTGREHRICHPQDLELTDFVKSIETNTTNKFQYYAETWMIDGIKGRSHNVEELFKSLNVIFPVMHNAMKDLTNEQ